MILKTTQTPTWSAFRKTRRISTMLRQAAAPQIAAQRCSALDASGCRLAYSTTRSSVTISILEPQHFDVTILVAARSSQSLLRLLQSIPSVRLDILVVR